jgi:hypothetical protein
LTPRWLDRTVALCLTGLLAFALAAVPLAMLGLFSPAPVVILTAAFWFGLWRLAALGSVSLDAAGPDAGLVSPRAAAAALLVVVAVTALNVRFSSQHLLTERDPGVYVNTARWLATSGGLLVEPQRDAYRGLPNEQRVQFAAAGYYEGHRADGKLYPQFVHLLPATLAASDWVVGSRGMLKVNALLGGLALLVFFVFATKLLRGWTAVGATAALGLNLIQVHFSRDAYTEILTQVLLFGGLWALLSARRALHAGRAALAGLLVGAAAMARLDALVFLVPLGIYVVYEAAAARGAEPRLRRFLVSLCAGAALPAGIAIADARLFSPIYLNDLWSSVRFVWAALILIAVGGVVLLALRPRLPVLVDTLRARRPQLALLAGVGIAGLAVLAYFVRPLFDVAYQANVNRFVESLQTAERLVVDGRRTYAEHTMQWLALYLGPAGLWGGIAGVALMTRDVILGRAERAVTFVLAFLPMTALYVWNPNITPDHPWALRRFLPISIPGLVLGCFWLVDRLWADPQRFIRRVLGVAVALWAVAFPAWTLAPVYQERTEQGLLTVTEKLCDYLPPDAAVVVAQTQLLDQNLTQTVRGFCDVPSANAPMDQPLRWYREIATRWAQRGKSLYIVSPQRGFGLFWPPDVGEPITAVTFRNLERTLTGRPDSYESFTLALFARRIEPLPR